MNLTELLFEIGELGVQNPRLEQDYRRLINRAQKAICQRRNWTFMHGRLAITITAGSTSAALPATFKCAAEERSPLSYSDTNGQAIPVQLTSRAQLERAGENINTFSYSPIQFAFLERNTGGVWALYLPQGTTTTEDTVFSLSAYSYPADLALGTDHNALTDDASLSEALMAKAKAYCYAVNPVDPAIAACEAIYEKAYSQATYQDARAALGGRPMHW